MAARSALISGVLAATVLVSGCGAVDARSAGPAATASITAPTSSTLPPKDALEELLLTEADIAGSEAPWSSTRTGGAIDGPACDALGPLARTPDPNHVLGPELRLTLGRAERFYSSEATTGPPEQVAAFVSAFAADAGTTCARNILGTIQQEFPGLSVVNPEAEATRVNIADGGTLVTAKGQLLGGRGTTGPVPMGMDIVVFRRGGVLVIVSTIVFFTETVPGDTSELARKIARRLP